MSPPPLTPSGTALPPSNIVIVGAGIIGVSTAYFLSHHPDFNAAHTSITLLEGSEVAAGASGKAGGLLALDWHGPATASLATLSYGLHASLAKQYDGASKWGYRPLDTLSISTNAKSRLSQSAAAVVAAQIPSEIDWLDTSIVRKIGVLGNTSTTAQVHPRKFCHTLLELAQHHGVTLTHGHVTKIEAGVVSYEDADGAAQRVPSDCTVVTAGPWTSTLVDAPIGATRAHSITIKTAEPVTPHALFTEMTLKDGRHVSPEIYARSDEVYVCGEGDEEVPLPQRASQVAVVEAKCDVLKEFVDALSPVLRDGEVGVKQACYLPTLSTGPGPVLGRLKEGVYVAAGHSCWGICLGPGTGKIMSELIMEGAAKSANIRHLTPESCGL